MSDKTDKCAVVYAQLAHIKPDPDQPRKNFDIKKINILAKMIKEDGLLEPLKVEKISEDNYLLVDGERRYRACKIVGLKEVPVMFLNSMSTSDRLIKQFHIQESREDWTTLERSKAIHDMSETLTDKKGNKLSHLALGQLLGLDEKTIRTSLAFGNLHNKEDALMAKIGADLIPDIVAINRFAKREYQAVYQDEFTDKQQEKFESKIINLCEAGKISGKRDMAKIKDAIMTKPETIKQILNNPIDQITPDGLFLKSHAQSAYALRNVVNGARNTIINGRRWLKTPKIHPVKKDITTIKTAIKVLKEIETLYSKKMDIETEEE